MLPPAPARLSTMTGWPSSVVSAWPMMRARMSVVPPAAKGTTMVTGLVGVGGLRQGAGGDGCTDGSGGQRGQQGAAGGGNTDGVHVIS